MKTLLVALSIAFAVTACSHKDNTPNNAEGYTHADTTSTEEGTGKQEEEMSSGDPQNNNY